VGRKTGGPLVEPVSQDQFAARAVFCKLHPIATDEEVLAQDPGFLNGHGGYLGKTRGVVLEGAYGMLHRQLFPHILTNLPVMGVQSIGPTLMLELIPST